MAEPILHVSKRIKKDPKRQDLEKQLKWRNAFSICFIACFFLTCIVDGIAIAMANNSMTNLLGKVIMLIWPFIVIFTLVISLFLQGKAEKTEKQLEINIEVDKTEKIKNMIENKEFSNLILLDKSCAQHLFQIALKKEILQIEKSEEGINVIIKDEGKTLTFLPNDSEAILDYFDISD